MSNKKRIEEIDKQINKLQKEKEKLLKEDLTDKSRPIMERISNLSQMPWEITSSIREPFQDYIEDFAKQIKADSNRMIIDDYCILSMDIQRHQNVTIEEIAECMIGYKKSAEEQSDVMVKILYDRMSNKFYEIPLMDALLHLEKWSLENEIFEWECDW